MYRDNGKENGSYYLIDVSQEKSILEVSFRHVPVVIQGFVSCATHTLEKLIPSPNGS